MENKELIDYYSLFSNLESSGVLEHETIFTIDGKEVNLELKKLITLFKSLNHSIDELEILNQRIAQIKNELKPILKVNLEYINSIEKQHYEFNQYYIEKIYENVPPLLEECEELRNHFILPNRNHRLKTMAAEARNNEMLRKCYYVYEGHLIHCASLEETYEQYLQNRLFVKIEEEALPDGYIYQFIVAASNPDDEDKETVKNKLFVPSIYMYAQDTGEPLEIDLFDTATLMED